ncbi:MAG: hypothetical protein LBM38_02585 [Clostridiales bacterium]|jgi:V/A-type H+-transporting ATPase subunit E|nr:hypothetical protein [Clostridiales bacterium]
MSQLTQITDKIIAEAEEKANVIFEEADEEISSIRLKNATDIEQIKSELTDEAELKAQDYHEKHLSQKRQQVKNDILSAKRGVINDCFEHSLKLFASMSADEYKTLITKIVDKHKHLPSLDVTYLDDNLGVIIKSDKIIYNYSFAEIADFLRPELEPNVSEILFK